jgi:hypothetical protein
MLNVVALAVATGRSRKRGRWRANENFTIILCFACIDLLEFNYGRYYLIDSFDGEEER